MNHYSRRSFLKSTVLSSLLLTQSFRKAYSKDEADNTNTTSNKIVVFSKYLQNLHWENLAVACEDCGLDGIDLTVRDDGHVIPEKVEEDLPKVVEIFRKNNLDVVMITTRLLSAEEPYAEQILKTAGALKIPYARIGYHHYKDKINIKEQISNVKKDLQGLTTLAEKYNVILGYHNHSGLNNFGGPIWDLIEVFQEINSPYLGSNFDIGHVKAEGFGGAWKANTIAILPWIRMIAVKDFTVENNKTNWVPLGKGCVPVKEMFDIILKQGAFKGPISIHMEYNTKSEAEKLDYIKASAQMIKSII
ncbi:MAG TPA: sugar phosphate isomerase/epimerase family protein [Candidatus Hydrogenedens sp.]|nr:sugar phosphate isomerase/epimerase family protein [Candidatus Hydrogenedens sp.]HPP58639.1 sugar phosphate isomerase/epimerase family protein [Candidatus Hydrogenedens sp.]